MFIFFKGEEHYIFLALDSLEGKKFLYGFDYILLDLISKSSLLTLDFAGRSVQYTLHTL